MVCITPCSVVKMSNLQIGKYKRETRHRGVLYRAIRGITGLSQSKLAAAMGCTKSALVRREVTKRKYSIEEIVELQRIAGMTDAEWCELLRQIAK